LLFRADPDFETPTDADHDGVYDVTIVAVDPAGNNGAGLHDLQKLSVRVADVGLPAITSNGGVWDARLSVAENSSFVTNFTVAETSGDTRYSIVAGMDASRFVIDAITGRLSFAAAPDYEAPTDYGRDNTYEVIVLASAGELTGKQQLTVKVTNLNEFAITSNGGGDTATFSIAENNQIATTMTVGGTDPFDRFVIAGGADASRFAIDAATGVLRFIANPDFENAADYNHDNRYDVAIAALSTAGSSDVQRLTIIVTDVADTGVRITGNASANVISDVVTVAGQAKATAYDDYISGLGGNDQLIGAGGDDTLDGGANNDMLWGGTGADELFGGTGSDQFYFAATNESLIGASDRIIDFKRTEGDKIVLSPIDADTTTSGNQTFAFLGTGAFTGDAGQLRYQFSGADTLVTGDVDGDGIADFGIILQGRLSLAGTDFYL
jgi:Ca2+-binding RTX toxin-like protein